MKTPEFTLKVFGSYVIIMGLGLLLIPNLWLAPLGIPPASDIWVRVLGLVAIVLGYYYWVGALSNARSLMAASVWGRSIVFAGCVGLVLLAAAPWQLIIFGAVDLAGAGWTKFALAKDAAA